MDFSEYKKRLGAEPLSRDSALLEARRSGEEFERAAVEAEALEARIEATLNFPVDDDELLGRVLAIPAAERRPRFSWMARAASILVLLGLVSVAWYQGRQPATVEEYVAWHFQHDGDRVLSMAQPDFDATTVTEIMAGFEVATSPELVSMVRYMKLCPTLHGKGAHMILATESGPVTVIYMPDTVVENATLVRFEGMTGRLIALASGSAAIIRPDGQSLDGLDTLLQGSIAKSTVDT
jgi:hypothetical protein